MTALRFRPGASGRVVLMAMVALLSVGTVLPSTPASAASQFDWKAAQREAEQKRREAERLRREAEQKRREAQRQRQEAIRQQREAQRQKRLAQQRARQQQQQQKKQAQAQKQAQKKAQQAPSNAAQQKSQTPAQNSASRATPETSKSSDKSAAANTGNKQASESANADNASTNKDSANATADKTAGGDAAETEILDDVPAGPPPTMEKLLKSWFAPSKPAPQPPPPQVVPVEQPKPGHSHDARWQDRKDAHNHRRLKEARKALERQRRLDKEQPIDTGKPAATVEAWTERTRTLPAVPPQKTPVDAPVTKPVETAVDTPVEQVTPRIKRHVKEATTEDALAQPAPEPPAPVVTSSAPIGRPPPLELGLPPTPELLAVNASPKSIERARKLGFRIGRQSRFSKLNFSVTRVVAPKGMSPGRARSLLKSKFPEISFEHNRKYRIYKTATGVDDAGQPNNGIGTRLRKNLEPTPACTEEHCFPAKLIGWKPDLNRCATGTRIGIIDTSVDLTHPAFAGKKLTVSHFGRNSPPEPDWHGTGVAAILAGDSASGTPGLIPGAKFYLADVFYADDDGQPASDTESMLRAFDWMESKGVKIINMSLSGPRDELIKQAIAKLNAKGIVLVAAAGNDGPAATPSYPAAYDDVIAVTAVNKNLRSYRYANRGSYIDVAAPGVGIWTALPGARQGFHSGTSFATPYITATLATMVARHPRANASSLLQKLSFQDLGDPGPDPVYGMGLVRAPESCGGNAVAQAVVTGSTSRRSSRPTFAPASSAGGTEVLPWLGLHD